MWHVVNDVSQLRLKWT